MSAAAREKIKTLLIVALLVSAMTLGYFSSLFDSLSAAFSMSGTSSPNSLTSPAETSAYIAARPGVIVLTDQNGARSVTKYDMDALDAVYERSTSSLFGEALTLCGEPVECSEAEWRAALMSESVMYEFFTYVPLELLRDWLGTPGDGFGLTVFRVCLTYGVNGAALFFESRDGFFTSKTSITSDDYAAPAVFSEGVQYEFELDAASASPYSILVADYYHPLAVSTNPLGTVRLDMALAGLGIDIRQATSYTDSDGTEVYVSSLFTLSITEDGIVSYRRNMQDTSRETTPGGAVELAWRTVSATIGEYSGEARVYFTGCESENGAYTVLFDYFFAGGRVFPAAAENAARVTVKGGVVSDFILYCRSYQAGEAVALLPERLAAALRPDGFALGYSDAASSTPFWYSVREDGGA